ncbi:GDSL-type esterase/lipase family protein [Sinomonas sp. JGH33]|uniref:GDSL-type esterase/lipase family protein n=1 Tax=Sinomonas terricola TaxID=3110330 RepID=A0ABU5TD28_9MICC|nr:GDSL-type esterase/lipase family protein [Sinomonas sp. JGH33]MEA5456981.1 GDSL-type esterase/lipase family protein [Sinomonas sp. JGH33]
MRRTRIQVVGIAVLAAVTILLVVAAVMKPSLERANAQRPAATFLLSPSTPAATPSPTAAPPSPSASAAPSLPAPLRFAAVGDAITLGDSPDFAASRAGSLSWVAYAAGPQLAFAGGWAAAGATTAKIAAGVKSFDVDVLVIMAGTNDVNQGVPFAQTESNLDRIVAKAGVRRVLVSAIPPRNAQAQATADFNAALGKFAQQRGWTFVDAPAGVRDSDVYAAGMTLDGVRPTKDAAQIMGKAIALALAP